MSGPDGSGKSTLSRSLSCAFSNLDGDAEQMRKTCLECVGLAIKNFQMRDEDHVLQNLVLNATSLLPDVASAITRLCETNEEFKTYVFGKAGSDIPGKPELQWLCENAGEMPQEDFRPSEDMCRQYVSGYMIGNSREPCILQTPLFSCLQ